MNIRFAPIVFLLWLSGCSGGISGTGDGGPVVTIDGSGNGNGGATTGNSSPEDNLPETADTTASQLASFPQQLFLTLPNTLQTASMASTNNSQGDQLRQAITSSQQDMIAVQIDLFLLDAYLNPGDTDVQLTGDITDTLGDAAGNAVNTRAVCTEDTGTVCVEIAQRFIVTVDNEAEALASRQQALYLPTALTTFSSNTRAGIRTGDAIAFENLSLQNGLSGFFDNRLQYRRDDDSQVTLLWSSDQQWVSLLARNADATLYSLLELDNNKMTLRRKNHLRNDTSIQLLALQNTANLPVDATYIEADLNEDQPFFIRATGYPDISAIYAESLLPSRQIFRETADATGKATNIDVCNAPCLQWEVLLASQELASSTTRDSFFSSNRDIADRVSETIVSQIDTTLIPIQVNEFVIARNDSTGGTNPNQATPDILSSNLVCGGQRLSNGIKTFCWQPTPIGESVSIFEESRANGATTYRLITQSDSL